MELIERAHFFASLEAQLEKTRDEGHCVFIGGEAGIGKSSLINSFCQTHKEDCLIYTGICDALFTPRPLAPLYDIAGQLHDGFWQISQLGSDRTALFASIFHQLSHQKRPTIVVFEDVHWADEATLDFIKFFIRRITQTCCLFLLTYRDNEIHTRHPLRHVMGELVRGSFTRLLLPPLSRQAVEQLSEEKGYKGEDVYHISGGNPFYVQEILASYSPGIPDTIKDSILLVYNRQDDITKEIWDLLAVLPTGLEIAYLEKIDPHFKAATETSLNAGILVIQDGFVRFKHELYRRTIEESLSPLKRIDLNQQILARFQFRFEEKKQIERLIHHAKNANAYELVLRYAPGAAREAAGVGAHFEAAKLYITAITYYQGNDQEILLPLYEAYAYECYLTNQITEAIIYQGKVLASWKPKDNREKVGDSLRFLSRLWWYNGNRKKAEEYAEEAVQVLLQQPASYAKAMAFSNMSQLKMLADQPAECVYWGEKAIAMAQELQNEDILSHALNNVGTVRLKSSLTRQEGFEQLRQSLAIALHHSYHEHAARAYTNLSSMAVETKEYRTAQETLEAGLRYCDQRELDSWKNYMLCFKARLSLETGQWAEASTIASRLLEKSNLTPIVKIGALTVLATIRMRSEKPEVRPLLEEAKAMAFQTQEHQRIVPVMMAWLEYEWLTGQLHIDENELQDTIQLVEKTESSFQNSAFAFWLLKARNRSLALPERYMGYDFAEANTYKKAVQNWVRLGCPYEEAMLLMEGLEDDRRKALTILQELGAETAYKKLKQELRAAGMKKIPRGMRESTRLNPRQLTNREVDVLQLLSQNMQNKEIANTLFLSAKTVDHHISSILLKLNVSSRGKAVTVGMDLGILK